MANWLDVRWLRRCAGVVVGVGMTLILAHGARGQVAFELLHAFGEGIDPCTTEDCRPNSLIQARDGTFYDRTTVGGTALGINHGGEDAGAGTVFQLTAAGTLSAHALECSTEECASGAGLIRASDGNFYGNFSTTFDRNGDPEPGSVFKLTLCLGSSGGSACEPRV